MRTVKEISDLTGISVRTLHYYDEIGLLKPTEKSDAGYRLYDDKALETLQQILFFREFDISLKEIKAVLDNPALERNQILQVQRKMLVTKKERMERLIASIDDILKGENKMDFTIFTKTEVEEMFQTMLEHMPENMRNIAIKEFGSIEQWKKHYMEVVSSEEMQKGYGSVIHIRQAVKVVKGTVSIGSPKSKDSIRDIPVPLNVRPCAIKLRDTTDQFIWESPKTGLPCNPTHFRDVFRKSLEEAGDVRLLTPHSCRHTYVSQMQALGVDIQTIQSIVGHADTEMTEHYLHVQESIRQSAIQLFSEAFSA